MCGRARFAHLASKELKSYEASVRSNNTTTSDNSIRKKEDIDDSVAHEDYISIENLSPGMKCPVLYYDEHNQPHVTSMTWGLIPTYLKTPTKSDHYRIFNKRIESLLINPANYFKSILEKKRCVMFLDGFYEWKSYGGKKYPHYIYIPNQTMKLPGIYEDSIIYENNIPQRLQTFSILTCESCPELQSIHNRQPVFLIDNEQVDAWLRHSTTTTTDDILNIFEAHIKYIPSNSLHTSTNINISEDKNHTIHDIEHQQINHPQQLNNPTTTITSSTSTLISMESQLNKLITYHPVTSKITSANYQNTDCSHKISLGKLIILMFLYIIYYIYITILP